MSKKFIKIFGICICAVLLPVLIVVSIVCLTHNDNGNGGKPGDPNSFTVYSDYAEDTTLKYDEASKSWKVTTIPARKYYTFTGIKVDGVNYVVTDGAVVLSETEKAEFEKDVKANEPITTTWESVYSYINITVEGTWTDPEYCAQIAVDINPNTDAIETTGFFASLNYQSDKAEITEFKLKDANNASTVVTIAVADSDRANGDITIRTVLDKIEAQGVTLTLTANDMIKLVLVD